MINLFDCHCDSLTTALNTGRELYENDMHLSLKTLSGFNCSAQVFAVWLDDKFIEEGYKNTNSALDFFDETMAKHRDILVKAVDRESLDKCKTGKIAAVLSIEGGEGIGDSIDNLDLLYNRGIRLITLTWNRENLLGYGALTGINKPLKPFGIEVLKKMEKLNIIADVSHLNEAGFYSLCENATKPFIASHSNAYSLCKNLRNLKDEQLSAMSELNSMVGINLYPPFLNENEVAGIYDILKHGDYILNFMGEDNVCLGCDFDGIAYTPEDIKNVGDLPKLYIEFEKAFGKKTAEKVFFDNLYKFVRSKL